MDKLLETALEAAKQVQRAERKGLIRQWIDGLRREQRLRMCYRGHHDVAEWRFMRDQCVWGTPKGEYPVRIDRIYMGTCVHCGRPVHHRLMGI